MTTDIKFQAFRLLLATDIQDMDIQTVLTLSIQNFGLGNINFVITTHLIKYSEKMTAP